MERAYMEYMIEEAEREYDRQLYKITEISKQGLELAKYNLEHGKRPNDFEPYLISELGKLAELRGRYTSLKETLMIMLEAEKKQKELDNK